MTFGGHQQSCKNTQTSQAYLVFHRWPGLVSDLSALLWRRQIKFWSWVLHLFSQIPNFSVSVQASAAQPHIEIQSSSSESAFYLVTHSLNWPDWNRWILRPNISWITGGLAGFQTVWLSRVCVSCSRGDAVRFMCWQRLARSSTSGEVWSPFGPSDGFSDKCLRWFSGSELFFFLNKKSRLQQSAAELRFSGAEY